MAGIMPTVRISVDQTALERANSLLHEFPGEAQKATWRAAKRAGQAGKTQAKRYASKVYKIKSRTFDENTSYRVKQTGGGSGTTSIKIIYEGNLIDLVKFDPKENRPNGVSYTVKRGTVIHAPHAFKIHQYGSRVFKRVGKPRFPVRKLLGPATPIMLNDEEVKVPFGDKIMETFNKRLEHEVNYILSRL